MIFRSLALAMAGFGCGLTFAFQPVFGQDQEFQQKPVISAVSTSQSFFNTDQGFVPEFYRQVDTLVPPGANDSSSWESYAQQIEQATGELDESEGKFDAGMGGEIVFLNIDFVNLRRTGPSAYTPLIVDDTFTTLYSDSDDINFGTELVPIFRLGFGNPNGSSLEVEYWHSVQQSIINNNESGVTPIFFGGIPADPVAAYSIDVSSNIDNGEINKWTKIGPRLRTGVGLRYVDYREIFDIIENVGSSSRDGVFSRTQNRMFGPQLAADFAIKSSSSARLFVNGKIAALLNQVDVDAFAANFEIHPDESEISLAADLKAGAEFGLTRHASFRLGYQATVLDHVAQSVDQSSALDILNAADPGDIDYSTVVFYGFFGGIQLAY